MELFFACALLLPPLPFRWGDTGPHVALLFAGAGMFVGFLRLSEWRVRADGLLVALLALWAILAGSLAMALIYSGWRIAAGSFARVLLFAISVYIFLYVRDGPDRMQPHGSFRWIQFLF